MTARIGYHEQQKVVAYFCVFIISIFSAMRGYVGTDTYSYHMMFIENINENIIDIIKIIEPSFALLIKSVALVTDNSFVFIALISIIQGLVLVKLVSTSKNPIYFLMIYIAVFYLNFQFNILRAGTAVLFLVLASRIPNEGDGKIKFYLIGIVAVLTHYSAVVGFLPMIFIRQRTAAKRFIAVGLILVALVFMYYFMHGNEALYGKYLIYSNELVFDGSPAISKSFIFSLPLYFLLYIGVARKGDLLGITFFFFIWLVVRWMTSIFMIMGRVEIIVNALLLFSVVEYVLVGWRYRVRSIALVGLVVMWLYGTLTFLGEQNPAMSGSVVLDENHLMSPFNPYKFFWEER